MTDQELEEWRAHPVTVALQNALEGQVAHNKRLCLEAYWQGRPNEDSRVRMRALEEFMSDLFGANAEDLKIAMEFLDEQQRVDPD